MTIWNKPHLMTPVAIYTRKYREKHPDRHIETQKKYKASRRKFMDELKSKPCQDCGNSYPPYCMDFDHKDPTTKIFDPSQFFRRKMEKLLTEVAKCDLVCSNCHRIRSHKQGF